MGGPDFLQHNNPKKNDSRRQGTNCFPAKKSLSSDERLDLGGVLVEANFPRGTASQRHYPSLASLCR